MVKGIFIGLLCGIIGMGLLWFFVGRNQLGGILTAVERSNIDFETVQRNLDQLETDADGFAGKISVITDASNRVAETSRHLDSETTERLGIITGELGSLALGVDSVAEDNRDLIRLGRDLGDVAYEYRRLSEGSTEAE